MMRAALLLLLCLAACSGGSGADTSPDLAGPANAAEADIANYAAAVAAGRRRPAARPVATPTPAGAARVMPGVAIGADPAAGGASDPRLAGPVGEDTGAATAVVRRYHAAIAARDYRAAWAMWADHGRAAGMSEAAFAASFGGYASYDATVGVPFDADAGAGQRYISVPVRISAVLHSGEHVVLTGAMVLHRVADGIETEDPADHRWAIRSSTIRPAPTNPLAAPVAARIGNSGD